MVPKKKLYLQIHNVISQDGPRVSIYHLLNEKFQELLQMFNFDKSFELWKSNFLAFPNYFCYIRPQN